MRTENFADIGNFNAFAGWQVTKSEGGQLLIQIYYRIRGSREPAEHFLSCTLNIQRPFIRVATVQQKQSMEKFGFPRKILNLLAFIHLAFIMEAHFALAIEWVPLWRSPGKMERFIQCMHIRGHALRTMSVIVQDNDD